MGQIVLHAGTPKCGSTAVQQWLESNHGVLRDEHGVHLVHAARSAELQPFDPAMGDPTCVGSILAMVEGAKAGDTSAVVAFLDQLDRLADELGRIVVSHELIWNALERDFEGLAVGLEQLAARHDVELIAYVRAQHESLASHWRMQGFLSELPPTDWILAMGQDLHYEALVARLGPVMPSVALTVRPMPSDGLGADFAQALGFESGAFAAERVANVGLPLDLAILLRGVPADFFSGRGETAPAMEVRPLQWRLAALAADWNVAPSPKAVESLQILQSFAYETYAAGNDRLASMMGWSIGPLVEATDGPTPGLEALNSLWTPDLDDPAVQLLRHAIDAWLTEVS